MATWAQFTHLVLLKEDLMEHNGQSTSVPMFLTHVCRHQIENEPMFIKKKRFIRCSLQVLLCTVFIYIY